MADTNVSDPQNASKGNIQEKDVEESDRSGSVSEGFTAVVETNGLHRKLEGRHMQMIAIGMQQLQISVYAV